MKVCYYNHVGKVSGAEHVLFALLRCLPSEIEKTVISPASPEIEGFCSQQGISHFRVGELRARFTLNPLQLLRYSLSAIRSVFQVRRTIDGIAPDILHANSTRAGMIATLACAGRPTQVIWHAHDQFRPHPITRVVCLLLRSSKRNSVIAVSHSTADSLRRLFNEKDVQRIPIQVIHNGVNADAYGSMPRKVQALREELGLQQDGFTAAVVGQITRRKGQSEIVETFAKLCKSRGYDSAFRLLIVGSAVFEHDRDYLAALKMRVKKLGVEQNILFLGQRKDVPVILQSVRALISNSSSEPFGMVLLEACASRTPVIAASVDGVPELIDDGVSGLLYQYGDTARMYKLLEVLAADQAYGKRLGEAARERTSKEFTLQGFSRRVEEFYKFLLAGSAPKLSTISDPQMVGADADCEGAGAKI